jgi:DNA-binding transcriptional LysR family regulator
METFSSIECFVRSAEVGSFAETARRLSLTPAAVGYLETGRLQRVLPDWYIDDGYTSIYYAEHKLLPGKTRAFVDFIIEQFAERGVGQRFSAL